MGDRVLVVEDDPELRATLRQALSLEGYDVSTAMSVADARAQILQATGRRQLDLVLLDLGLPDGEGAQVLALLREQAPLPVLVLSARHDDGWKIRMLDEGADDYLVKPFSVGELLARMRVALRHRGRQRHAATIHYAYRGVRIDLEARRVRRDDQAVHLTPTEYKLLARLVRSAGRLVTHRQLLVDVWGAEHAGDTHYLRLYMAQLRAKLEADPAEPQWLLTEAGVGYRLAEPDSGAG